MTNPEIEYIYNATAHFIWDELGEGMSPKLEDFERVLGRKFTCKECHWFELNCSGNPCINLEYDCFHISDATKAEIKMKDKEIAETKIDTHPRFKIGSLWTLDDKRYSLLEIIL